MRLPHRQLVVVLAAAVLVPVAGAAKKPKTTLTPAGTAAADRALVTAGDFGQGWRAAGASGKLERLGCGDTSPSPKGVIEIGTATSPTYEKGASGPFVSQAAFVYRTAAEANTLWPLVAGQTVLGCLAKSVVAGDEKGVRFEIVGRKKLSLPVAGARSSAYRVVVRVVAKYQSVTAYVDMVLLGRGAGLTALSFAGFSQPLDTSFELSLARTAARRL